MSPPPSPRRSDELALSGVAARLSRSRARATALTWLGTGAELLWALRPHFFVLPALAALAGAASAAPAALSWRSALAAVIAAAGWGAGQLLNDFWTAPPMQSMRPIEQSSRGASRPVGPS